MFSRHPASDSSKLHQYVLLMPELCSFLCLKLYPCMGIRYAKLLEAAKSMFKSCDSRAV